MASAVESLLCTDHDAGSQTRKFNLGLQGGETPAIPLDRPSNKRTQEGLHKLTVGSDGKSAHSVTVPQRKMCPFARGTAEFKIYAFLEKHVSKPESSLQLKLPATPGEQSASAFQMNLLEMWRFLSTYCGHSFTLSDGSAGFPSAPPSLETTASTEMITAAHRSLQDSTLDATSDELERMLLASSTLANNKLRNGKKAQRTQ